MFKKGDIVICTDTKGIPIAGNREYVVSKVIGSYLYLEGDGGNFYSKERFYKVAQEPCTPIWNSKKPEDMDKEELKAFVCDRIDGVEMEYKPSGSSVWKESRTGAWSSYARRAAYRVKPSKSDKLIAAEKALEDAQAAVKVAQEAVEKAKE